ncbi:MAG: chorismate mutase family protein [Pseudomonadota bacterium]
MTARVSPDQCQTMETLRDQIDLLDAELVSLLAERTGYIDRAIELKQVTDLPARIPHRVEEVVMQARRLAEKNGLDPDQIETMWRQLVDWSIDREAQVIRRD